METSDSSSVEDNNELVPQAIRDAAQCVSINILPDKSKQLYTAAYNAFKKWRRIKGTNSFCEDVVVAYFAELSKKYAPASLWPVYSMVKCTIKAYNQIDIGKYKTLLSYLKKLSKGQVQKKSQVFTRDNISKFLNEAPDEVYLCEKVNKS